MTFDEAIEKIQSVLALTGTTIDKNDYDGIIVKKLEASNTLDDGRTTNQTHIAITGAQMDIFPYLRSDGYFNETVSDADLKKYFITQIPLTLHESNVRYLDADGSTAGIIFTSGVKKSHTSVVRSKRRNQADQIQVSLINFDGADFVTFRRLLHTGSYLIILKKKQRFEYEAYGVIPNKGISADGGLQSLNNQFYKAPTNTLVDVGSLQSSDTAMINYEQERIPGGSNILLYGVPGSGKSWTIEHEYCKKDSNVERLVFHPDYTYSDFVGQILPDVSEDGQVSYKFTPGPFTTILRDAYVNPQKEYILIIEEINRGNAPAIFGEVFQLLDRKVAIKEDDDDGFPIGTSEYGITNKNIALEVYGDARHKVRIPSNLTIIGTMNTSDQNVFTLDTAFQRRWEMRMIENSFDRVDPKFANAEILDTTVTWKNFCVAINDIIVGNNARMTSAEDKRLGAYFVHLRDLEYNDAAEDKTEGEYDNLCKKEKEKTLTSDEKKRLEEIREAMKHNRRFPEKVIKYLWDDAFKFSREVVFETNEYQSLEAIIRKFMQAKKFERFAIFKQNVRDAFINQNNTEQN
jgi:hypothetical protein